jgi:hypothetical protein
VYSYRGLGHRRAWPREALAPWAASCCPARGNLRYASLHPRHKSTSQYDVRVCRFDVNGVQARGESMAAAAVSKSRSSSFLWLPRACNAAHRPKHHVETTTTTTQH